MEALHGDAYEGNLEGVLRRIEKCPVTERPHLINAHNSAGFTPLQAAIFSNNVPIVETLLKFGASVNIPTSRAQHTTSLHMAALIGNPIVTKLLLNLGADPFVEDWDGWTPLKVAQINGHKPLISLLTEAMNNLLNNPVRPLPSFSFANEAEEEWWRVRRISIEKNCEDEEHLSVHICDHYSDGGASPVLVLKQEKSSITPLLRKSVNITI